MPRLELHLVDWLLVGSYLVLSLAVGLKVRGLASENKNSYFLANRSLPWWWAGASIAATTFAADTPLAITGIVASKGISGNWIWLSWIGVHAAVVVYFAARWNKSGVLTDAEIVSLRYTGRPAETLRWFRAGLYGLVYNCIILGWVLRAMVKIVTPFFHWDLWLPGLFSTIASVWPQHLPLGTPSEALTIVLLLAVVGTYSSLGGIRGVILTDLFQLGLALVGSFWLAFAAWSAVGGRDALLSELTRLYGEHHRRLELFPSSGGWLSSVGVGAFAFGLYLIVQSYANIPADGGGYLMQRLNTTPSGQEAQRASAMFVLLQYCIRVWPWLVVAVAALVLIPVGAESSAFGGTAAGVAADRELAYPVLIAELLPPAAVGLLLTSLLAAFMSTVDTHINWGASYVVNDVYLRLRPNATPPQQVRIARLAVLGFVVAAVLVSLQIDTIEQAWKWVAAIGAALGVPTALRWLWWRITATAELGAMVAGLATAAFIKLFANLPYEIELVVISATSIAGMLAGMFLGPATPREQLDTFVRTVEPHGFWPGRSTVTAGLQILVDASRWLGIVGGVVLLLAAAHKLLFSGSYLSSFAYIAAGAAAFWWGASSKGRELAGSLEPAIDR